MRKNSTPIHQPSQPGYNQNYNYLYSPFFYATSPINPSNYLLNSNQPNLMDNYGQKKMQEINSYKYNNDHKLVS